MNLIAMLRKFSVEIVGGVWHFKRAVSFDGPVTFPFGEEIAGDLDITGVLTAGSILGTVQKIPVPASAPVNAVAAVGDITLSGLPTAADTFTVNGVAWTWRADATLAHEVTIGGTAELSIDAAVTAVALDPITGVALTKNGTTKMRFTATTKGVIGNAITFVKSMANSTINGSGVLGGTTAGVNGTVAAAKTIVVKSGYVYFAETANTIADAGWVRVQLSAF